MFTCYMQIAFLILINWIGTNDPLLRSKRVRSRIMADNYISEIIQCCQLDPDTSRDNPPVLSDALSASSTKSNLQANISLHNAPLYSYF